MWCSCCCWCMWVLLSVVYRMLTAQPHPSLTGGTRGWGYSLQSSSQLTEQEWPVKLLTSTSPASTEPSQLTAALGSDADNRVLVGAILTITVSGMIYDFFIVLGHYLLIILMLFVCASPRRPPSLTGGVRGWVFT